MKQKMKKEKKDDIKRKREQRPNKESERRTKEGMRRPVGDGCSAREACAGLLRNKRNDTKK